MDYAALAEKSRQLRRDTVSCIASIGVGHIGGALKKRGRLGLHRHWGRRIPGGASVGGSHAGRAQKARQIDCLLRLQ